MSKNKPQLFGCPLQPVFKKLYLAPKRSKRGLLCGWLFERLPLQRKRGAKALRLKTGRSRLRFVTKVYGALLPFGRAFHLAERSEL